MAQLHGRTHMTLTCHGALFQSDDLSFAAGLYRDEKRLVLSCPGNITKVTAQYRMFVLLSSQISQFQ